MGRGRGKGRKLTAVSHEDTASGEDEKVPVQKRRGRPQKPLKVGIDEQEIEKVEDNDSDNKGSSLSGKEMSYKRKRNCQSKDKQNHVKEESDGAITKPSSASGSSTPSGFRQSWSRRKSTPRRAAEAGVKIDILFSIDTPTG